MTTTPTPTPATETPELVKLTFSAAALVADGWPVDAAIRHADGTCDPETCEHDDHAVWERI